MTKTNWFPHYIRPVHSGWYEVGHSYKVHPRASYYLQPSKRFWDGRTWRAGWLSEQVSIFGNHDSHQWRGIDQKSYFSITGVKP